jgi:uncharacterized protein (DUF2147 family)
MKILTTFLFVIYATISFGQSPEGVWKTIDDETNEAKSHVQIFEKDGKFYGKIVKLLKSPPDTKCTECEGDKKDKLVLGMQILEGLKPYKDYWSYGQILDPENGNTYKCNVWLDDSEKLKVRGYIGVAALGRTQTWHRVE